MSYLSWLPVHGLNIDRDVIEELDQADGLIAEGIETDEQRTETAVIGCDYSQGFYFARPMLAADTYELIAV